MRRIAYVVLAAVAVLMTDVSQAAVKKGPAKSPAKPAAKPAVGHPTTPGAHHAPPPAPANDFRRAPYVGALALDAKTGRVLFCDGADRLARPASVTKLMTALLVLEDVKAGRYGLNAPVSAGPMALLMEPSVIGFFEGKPPHPVAWSVDTLLYALMIRSANDAAVALAEHSAGSLEAFVARMNKRAKSLGMDHTVYYNPNGLPPNAAKKYPWKSFNVTTCFDQAKLAREIVLRHPELLRYTSRKTWTMPNGQNIINHNNVMRMDKWKIINPDGTEAVDGLKTGYIDAGGSSVVLTGQRSGRRAIVVVLGSDSRDLRDSHARSLMSDALSAL